MKIFIIAIALVLAGCATSFDTFNKTFPKLKGQPIDFASNYLGDPDEKKTIDDKDIYIWELRENFEGNQLSCKIKLTAQNGIITHTAYNGANGTCMKYARRLRPLLDQN